MIVKQFHFLQDIEQSANAPNSGRKDDDEDADSGDFEPEAAVASALRLQMFLEHPELEEGHRMVSFGHF